MIFLRTMISRRHILENKTEMDYSRQPVSEFSTDVYAIKTTGVKIVEAKVGYAKCSLKIDERHFNVNGDVMGGAIFTLADYAFGVAANTGNAPTVSLTSTINFIRPTRGPELYAEAKCVKSGRKICFVDVTVTDGNGKLIATVASNGFVTQ